jgi:hypothetical protein
VLGKQGGKWFVADKKRNSTTISKDSLKLGYKGWFDAPPPKPEEDPAEE